MFVPLIITALLKFLVDVMHFHLTTDLTVKLVFDICQIVKNNYNLFKNQTSTCLFTFLDAQCCRQAINYYIIRYLQVYSAKKIMTAVYD